MTRLFRFARGAAGLVLGATMLSACAVTDLEDTPQPMGRFLLGHNIALVADNVQVGPLSRTVENDAWVASVRNAVNDRFSRYDGDQYFHVSVTVLGYVLAQPGIPIVASAKSVLIADVRVFDDSQGGKPTTEEPKQFTVLEELGGDMLVGSGLTRSAEEQMDSLTRNLAKQIHEWMLDNEAWFGDAALMDPATTTVGRPVQPLPPMPGTQADTPDA